jgi:MraZ protein
MPGDVSQISDPVLAPFNTTSAKVDEKGRLKLPSDSLDWCRKSNILKVFVTTIDMETFQIYSIPGWMSTLKVLEGPGDNAEAFADLAMIAKTYGDTAEIDSQGRMLLPAPLRKLLSLESQPVWLTHVLGRIEGATNSVHEARMRQAAENLKNKVGSFKKLGL